jgi:hypothetical protein
MDLILQAEPIADVCSKCVICQTTKKSTKKYGQLPPKIAESVPWEIMCMDLIGPYQIDQKMSSKPLVLWAMTMIDPATGWCLDAQTVAIQWLVASQPSASNLYQ